MFWPFGKKLERKLQVLLVEDNPGDAILVRRALSDDGVAWCGLHHADTVARGLACLPGRHFDVVLLDMSLPDADGLEGVEAFRRTAPDLPIVMLSGQSEQEVALEAVKAGAQDFLVKEQVPPALLRRSLLYALERQEMLRQLEVATSAQRLDAPSEPQPGDEEPAASEEGSASSPVDWQKLIGTGLTSSRQAIFDLETHEVQGEEFFVRGGEEWPTPEALFAEARRLQVSSVFDLLCLRHHLDAARSLPAQQMVFVNILPSTLLKVKVGDVLQQLAGRSPAKVCLEVDARAIGLEAAAYDHKVRRLRAAGLRIALDHLDFGANAFGALLVLEPDFVKLTGASLCAWSEDSDRRPWLRRLLSVLPELGCTPIVCQVESVEEASCVASWGLRLGQGYMFAAPRREQASEPWVFQL